MVSTWAYSKPETPVLSPNILLQVILNVDYQGGGEIHCACTTAIAGRRRSRWVMVHSIPLGWSLSWANTDGLYPRTTISKLPDDVLLDIFKFYLDTFFDFDRWHVLVHVCQRWRCLVFASPRRLDLQLLCTNRRPVKKTLDIWPALPIFIRADFTPSSRCSVSDVVFGLKQHDRICMIMIWKTPKSLFGEFVAIKGPFPVLTDLVLRGNDDDDDDDLDVPILPDSFLSGSAPRLRSLMFKRISFPALPKLLLSTTGLVILNLTEVPDSGFISPNAMATDRPLHVEKSQIIWSSFQSFSVFGPPRNSTSACQHSHTNHPPSSH